MGTFLKPARAIFVPVRARSMLCWQTNSYSGISSLSLQTVNLPVLRRSTQLLVKVHASSVNPLDILMTEGFGFRILNVMRRTFSLPDTEKEFPLTLGRDFSGTVVEKGLSAKKFEIGDQVWGTVNVYKMGAHSQYVIAEENEISRKPSNLTHVEAASLPYAAATAGAALSSVGRLTEKNARGKRVLVLGASGGVGTFAIQLLKVWGANVTATCSTDAVEMVEKLGPDYLIDYKQPDAGKKLNEAASFDFVLDLASSQNKDFISSLLQEWKCSKYVTTTAPLLTNCDKYGLLGGSMISALTLSKELFQNAIHGRVFSWAYFHPNGKFLNSVKELVEKGLIIPVIDKTYKFEQLPDAYSKVKLGHARGKTVIEMTM